MEFLSLISIVFLGIVGGLAANICWIFFVYLPICHPYRLKLISEKHKNEEVRKRAKSELDNHWVALLVYSLFYSIPIVLAICSEGGLKKPHLPHFEKFNLLFGIFLIISIISYFGIGLFYLNLEEKSLEKPMEDYEKECRFFQTCTWAPFIFLFFSFLW